MIILSEHITSKERVAKVQSSGGTTLDGYSLPNSVVTASEVSSIGRAPDDTTFFRRDSLLS
jgi:hypothetical protein